MRLAPNSRIVSLALALAAFSAGCGDCGSGVVDPSSDGGTDAGPPPIFDPAVTYAGEGNACRFSIQCGDRQICVDDQCVRHERAPVGSVHFGEWRQMTDAELDASPMYTRGGLFTWAEIRGTDQNLSNIQSMIGVQGWVTPGVDGPWHVFQQFNTKYCQLVVTGPTTYVISPANNMSCLTATVSEDGWVAAAGIREGTVENHLVVWNPKQEEVLDLVVTNDVNARLALPSNWGAGAQAGPFLGLYFYGGKLYASIRKGGATNYDIGWFKMNSTLADLDAGIAFLEVDMSGAMRVFPVGGKEVHAGRLGWIGEDANGLVSFQSTYVGPDPEDITFDVMHWSDGARTVLASELGTTGRYLQLTHSHWVAVLDYSPVCGVSVFDSAAAPYMRTLYTLGCPTVRDFAVQSGATRSGPIWVGPWPGAPGYIGESTEFTQLMAAGTGDIVVAMNNAATAMTTNVVVGHTATNVGHVETGAGVVRRFFKTYELPFVDQTAQPQHFLGWIERSMTRSTDGGI